ncbi:hypothetical protein AABB24_020982 [Solanum stoloniferum]|uniref:Uncharacterized protein n=1 Tax=Solanum stoloniferum TaxID=62892 RepID=A0ABD2TAC1_9SOLN
MEKPLFLQTTPPLLIAHLRNFPRLCWNGKQLVKGGNLIEFLGFGLVGLRFSEAALLNQGLMGLLGLSRRILQGIDGSFVTNASRSITLTGWVKSSYGNITTKSAQGLSYSNYMVEGNGGNLQNVDQIIYFNETVDVVMPSSSVQSLESFKKFLLLLHSDNVDKGDKSYASISNVTLGFDDKRVKTSKNGSSASSTENMQKAQGHILVKGQIVVSGVGSTQQVYKYKDNSFCYSRNISSSNYTIHYDKVSDSCPRSTLSRLPFSFGKFWSVPARRVSLASHFGDVKDGV